MVAGYAAEGNHSLLDRLEQDSGYSVGEHVHKWTNLSD
jgi:hypothetical protein